MTDITKSFDKVFNFEKALHCPACSIGVCGLKSKDLEFSLVRGAIVKIIHKTCASSCAGFFFACLECQKSSSKKPSQVRCQCESTAQAISTITPPTPPAACRSAGSPTISDFGSNDNDNFNETFADESSGSDQNNPDVGHNECCHSDSERKIEDFFADTDQCSEPSRKFFGREQKKTGDGKKGLICNALVDSKIESDFDCLIEEEVQYQLHLTSMFHGLSISKAQDIASMTRHIVKEGGEERKIEVDILRKCFDESCNELLGEHLKPGVDMDNLLKEMNGKVDDKMNTMLKDLPSKSQINHPTDYNTIQKNYTEGVNSVLQNLPSPQVKELDGFAYISVEQVVNHILAIGMDLLTFQKEDDWTNEKGEYEGTYYRDLHDRVKKLKEESEFTENVRVHIIRMWSDGFQAFYIKVDNEYNNLQLFTLTLLAPKGCTSNKSQLTLPFALGFKKKDHSKILNQLLCEVRQMQTMKARYCGRGKRLVDVSVDLQLCSNDYPERCQNTVTAQLGTFTHRWGYSSLFDEKSTPSCRRCERKRFEKMLDKNPDISCEAED